MTGGHEHLIKFSRAHDETTAHFAQVEGIVYCFGVPAPICQAFEAFLPYTYNLKTQRPKAILETVQTAPGRKIALLAWDQACAKRISFLIARLRASSAHLPICLWCPEPISLLPTYMLADGTLDYIFCGPPSPLSGAVMANLLLRSEKMHSLAQSCNNLAQASARDPLTGLFNHGTVLKALDNEYQRASRSKSPLSCLMLDIDHFKALNDTYGHRFGDWVLKELAVLLRNQVRATDIVGRYGGEEFLFVLPATDEEGALRLAEKIRLAVEERSFRRGDFQVLVTVSIGLASTSAEMGRGAEHLLQLSDRALYFAKENGRNRVASAHAHLSMLDFEPFGHKQSPLKHAEPVIALCSTDNSFVQRVAQLANRNKYILLVFEKSQEFFGALEALEPDVALVDRAEDLASPDFVRQLTARLHKHRVAVCRPRDRKQWRAWHKLANKGRGLLH
jgi:diguanylate cyclase (GGDEF)-like protein